MATKYSIIVKNYSDIFEEFEANAAITPGMLVYVLSTGKIAKQATAGGNVLPMVAIEDVFQGKGVNDAFAAGDRVRVWIPGRGDIANLLLRDEESVSIGDWVESDGEGRVRKALRSGDSVESNDAQQAVSSYPEHLIGQVVAAVDLSTLPEGSESSAMGDYANPKVQVRIK